MSRDHVDCPACGPESSRFDGSVRGRLSGGSELKNHCGVVPIGGAEPAVPSFAHVRILGPESQCEASQAGRATVTAKEGELVGLSLIRVVGVGIRTSTCGMVEAVVGRAKDQGGKLLLPAREEVGVVHCLLQLSVVPAVFGSAVRVSWAWSRRTRLMPSGPGPGVAQAAAGRMLALRRTGA